MEPPKTHDLVQLCKLCSERDDRFADLADACIELVPYGVQVRYPSDLELDERDVRIFLTASAGRSVPSGMTTHRS